METKSASNAWQNIGIFYIIGEEANLSKRDFCVFMYIVRNSVGYGEPFTFAKPANWFHENCGVGRRQWIEATANLEEMGMIKRIGHYGNLKGGGSTPFKYGPVFPDGTNVWLKDKHKSKEQKQEAKEVKKEDEDLKGW